MSRRTGSGFCRQDRGSREPSETRKLLLMSRQSILPPPSHSPIPKFSQNLDKLSWSSYQLQGALQMCSLSAHLVPLVVFSKWTPQRGLHYNKLEIDHVNISECGWAKACFQQAGTHLRGYGTKPWGTYHMIPWRRRSMQSMWVWS
jgi:hypothetical protein